MLSSCSATVFSTAIRSRITSAMARFSASTSLSLAIRDSSVSRSRAMTSSMRSFSMRSVSIAMTRSRFFCRDRDLAGLVLALDAELLLGAEDAPLRPSAAPRPATRAVSASSRARMVSISRCCLVSASACRRSSSRMASRASTFWRVISFSSCALELVGADVLDRGQLGDLPDALRVEDVVRVELGQRRLLQVVDRRVLEDVAVEVGADDLDDLVAELVALGVEVDEVELLADRLERLGELGVEQLLQRRPGRWPARCRWPGRP